MEQRRGNKSLGTKHSKVPREYIFKSAQVHKALRSDCDMTVYTKNTFAAY